MDIKQLEAFAHVVRLKSFSKAAEYMGLTQPTVSAHINTLERELDGLLLVRAPKAAYPTETGATLYEYALSILALRDNALTACIGHKLKMQGTLRIAASTLPGQYVLPGLMAGFREKYPEIRFYLDNQDSAGVADSILAGRAELGIAGAVMDEDRCAYVPFMEDQLVVITPNTKAYASSGLIGVDALTKLPFVLREAGSGTRREMEEFLIKQGVNPAALQVAAEVGEPNALKRAVSKGLGISILSRLAAEDFAQLGLIRMREIAGGPIRRRLYLVHHKSRPLTPIASAFVRYVQHEGMDAGKPPQTRESQIGGYRH